MLNLVHHQWKLSLAVLTSVLSTISCCTYTVGGLELVDVSAELPGLKRCPGLLTWQVCKRITDCK